jgi:hypothetical protein
MRNIATLILLGLVAAAQAAPEGHPSTGTAAQALHLPDKGEALPYRGKVLEAIDSNDYTYIRLATEEGERWLAAPRIALKEGAMVRFGDGTLMSNFYSKKLKRTFDAVLFVSEVKPDGKKK